MEGIVLSCSREQILGRALTLMRLLSRMMIIMGMVMIMIMLVITIIIIIILCILQMIMIMIMIKIMVMIFLNLGDTFIMVIFFLFQMLKSTHLSNLLNYILYGSTENTLNSQGNFDWSKFVSLTLLHILWQISQVQYFLSRKSPKNIFSKYFGGNLWCGKLMAGSADKNQNVPLPDHHDGNQLHFTGWCSH